MKKALLLLLGSLIFIVSCEITPPADEIYETSDLKAKRNNGKKDSLPIRFYSDSIGVPIEKLPVFEDLRNRFLQEDPSATCDPTELAPIIADHRHQLMTDPLARDIYGTYINLNRSLALSNTEQQYFGPNGEHTKLVEKRIRELERFWDMAGELQVKGQHSATLNDRDLIAAYFYDLLMDDRYWEDAYIMADEYINLNKQSPLLPESPLLASDGFTNYNKTILIGDGLVKLLSETGIDPQIIWSGILAHEWAHQIQLNHARPWYNSEPPFLEAPVVETELEADFFAAYFLTHKRGATYNWKRVELFLNLFFQGGDCNTENPEHHGTPQQRMLASRRGYELAENAQKKGHILTPEEVHAAFKKVLPQLLDASI